MKVEIKEVNLGELGKVSGVVVFNYGSPQTRFEPEQPPEIEGCTLINEHGNCISADLIFDNEELYDALLDAVENHIGSSNSL